MKISDNCIELIKHHEGVCPKAYICPAGKLTVGVGHLVLSSDNIVLGQEINSDRIDLLLKNDIAGAEAEVNKLDNIELLDQCMFDALVSFVFNLGSGNFRASTLRKKVVAHCRDFVPIGKEFEKWCYANKKVLNGLVKRRADEFALYCSEAID